SCERYLFIFLREYQDQVRNIFGFLWTKWFCSSSSTMMTTADSVKLYDPKRRECYFSSEKYLKYFKVYTANNCKMECLANYTKALCRCVNFFMPSKQ
ncbi:Epithelial sodium channel, partial [Gonioctena quinquepunctata]